MANITQWASAGLHSAQVGAVMSSGAQAGFANLTTASVGLASNMSLLVGGVTVPTPLPQTTRVYNRGRDGYIKSTLFDAQPNEFTMAFEDFNGDVSALLNHDTVLTLGEWDFVPEGGPVNFQNTSWLFSRHAASKEASSDGSEGYENLWVFAVSGRIEPGNMEFQAPGGFNVQGVASPVQKTPLGTTTLVSNGKLTIYTWRFFSDYPVSCAAFVGDASIVAIPLGYTPISTAKTKAYNFTDAAALTVSSISTGGKTATVSAAPASGKVCAVIYETTDI